jgi:monoamine oxidase
MRGNRLQTMKRWTRRSVLQGAAASATVLAAPALAGPAPAGDVDVLVVGAGAAGIAAARRIAAAGRRALMIEATDHVGGRCVTDTRTFGVPFDRGAHWIHMPDVNPVTKLAARTGLDVYRAPTGQRVRVGRRNAREGELEDFLAALVRANRAIQDASRLKTDITCAQALPKDLGDWRATVEFVLGPYGCARELDEISAFDFAKSAERDIDAFCRQGLGALLGKLAVGVPVRLSTPVTRLEWGSRLEAETDKGKLSARYAIVTVSTDLLTSGKLRFSPELPRRQLDAAGKLKLGSYDHVALELAGNPLGLQGDELVFEKSTGAQTGALLANISGTSLATVDVAGRFGRELAAKGEMAMVDFAVEWLAGLFGADVRKAVRRTAATRWGQDPWTLGAFAAAVPGAQGARKLLMEPLRDRLYFAGEAVHETLWGTVGGAWESGERAAEAVLRKMGVLKEPVEPKPARPSRKRV